MSQNFRGGGLTHTVGHFGHESFRQSVALVLTTETGEKTEKSSIIHVPLYTINTDKT